LKVQIAIAAAVVVVAALLFWTLKPSSPGSSSASTPLPDVPLPATPIGSAPALVAELGCSGCHTGVPTSDIGSVAPALDYAGLRYNPGYLFAFLQDPKRVRRHIGRARMPAFHLDERESLALTLFLATQESNPDPSPVYPAGLDQGRGRGSADDAARLIETELSCTSCHSMGGRGGDLAVDLATIGARLNPEWTRRYLAAPEAWDPVTPMPPLFFETTSSGELRERVPDAAGKINQIVDHLVDLGEDQREALQRSFEAARKQYPEVTAQLGQQIFVSQNCAGCHTRSDAPAWKNAPDLSGEGSRARPAWLREYVAHPVAVRPFGFYPGSGSRMPDFRLSAEEADSVAAYLARQTAAPAVQPAQAPAPPSAFAAAKAETLMREKFSCLGCHRLEGEGGMIGPDLSQVKQRLQPGYVHEIIRNPQHTVPGTVMPKAPLTAEMVDLTATYLLHREPASAPADRLSLVDNPIHFPAAAGSGKGLYDRFCVACHGEQGGGDGYNARFLPVRPTAHAAAEYISTRPDDTMYDGIHAGGAVLNRSHFMPAFGQTLGREQIRALVEYIRTLCNCQGPEWARDGTGPQPSTPRTTAAGSR
jgi:mono/diheme cytochrome c family protein